METNYSSYFEYYKKGVAKVHENLANLACIYEHNLLMSDAMLHELNLYNTNLFEIGGNLNTPMTDEIVKAILKSRNFSTLLFPITISKEIVNPTINERLAILIDIERRKVINRAIDEVLRPQREALTNENIVRRLLNNE